MFIIRRGLSGLLPSPSPQIHAAAFFPTMKCSQPSERLGNVSTPGSPSHRMRQEKGVPGHRAGNGCGRPQHPAGKSQERQRAGSSPEAGACSSSTWVLSNKRQGVDKYKYAVLKESSGRGINKYMEIREAGLEGREWLGTAWVRGVVVVACDSENAVLLIAF